MENVASVQDDVSADNYPVVETVRNNLKAHGTPEGNRHATGMPMTVNPTLVPTIVSNISEPSVVRDETSGTSQDNIHENNCKPRTSNHINRHSLHGKPNGNRYVMGNIGSVQDDVSADNYLGVETVSNNLKAHGTLEDSRHATGMTMTVNPTLVPTISSNKKR